MKPCDYCRGKGQLNATPCPICLGRGEVMDEQTLDERRAIVWDSDARCACGADPKVNDGEAINDPAWLMETFATADDLQLAEAHVMCPACR